PLSKLLGPTVALLEQVTTSIPVMPQEVVEGWLDDALSPEPAGPFSVSCWEPFDVNIPLKGSCEPAVKLTFTVVTEPNVEVNVTSTPRSVPSPVLNLSKVRGAAVVWGPVLVPGRLPSTTVNPIAGVLRLNGSVSGDVNVAWAATHLVSRTAAPV